MQFSVTTSDAFLHRRINLGAPSLDQLFAAVKAAASVGIPVVCRIQPALPRRQNDVFALIDRAAQSGVRFVAVEHLKLGMENHAAESKNLSSALGYDVPELFRAAGSKRAGREWMLPLSERLQPMLAYRVFAKKLGLLFGSADTDLLHLSDGNCCCNGTDLLLPGVKHFSFTMNEAIRRVSADGLVSFSSIRNEWRPEGSIKRYVNSKSRNGATIEDHLRSAWNRNSHGPSMTNFHGVTDTGEVDEEGMRIFSLQEFDRPG